MVSPTGLLTDYNPSVFNKELQNNYVLCHNYRRICRRTITRPYFTESCKKITRLCHIHRRVYRQLYQRKIPTDYAHPEAHTCLTRVRLHKYRRLYRRPLPTPITDVITDGFTHFPKRTHVWHVSVCTNTDGFSDGSKSLGGFSNFFLCAFQLISDWI